jgi:hypothetical protein
MDSPPSPSPAPNPQQETSQEKESSTAYLRSLLDKNLRITTTDKRMFWGAFKCTDHVRPPPLPSQTPPYSLKSINKLTQTQESNIVLQHTYEYRHPTLTAQQVSEAAALAAALAAAGEDDSGAGNGDSKQVKLDMTSRYLGLVVVPGKYIVRIEAEEFASQMRGREVRVEGVGEQRGIGGGLGVGVVGVS